MPATSGCTSRSNTSRPKRRRTNEPRLSSPSSLRRGTKYSHASRILPSGLRIGVLITGQIRAGAINANPSGTARNRPRRTTNARRPAALVGINSSDSPIRRQRSTANGRFVIKLSAPCSIKKPSHRSVYSDPPRRGPASNSVTAACGSNSPIRCAAASPAIPPPITAIRGRRFSISFMRLIVTTVNEATRDAASELQTAASILKLACGFAVLRALCSPLSALSP